jgi:predicted NBD/HSP70 family sugar kinase
MTAAPSPAGQRTVRLHNLRLVLAELSLAPGSRAELAQRTGLTKATVASLVDSLIGDGILLESEPAVSGPGRPARSLRFDPAGPVAAGIEINVDYTAVCLQDLTGRVRAERRLEIDNRAGSAEAVLRKAAATCREAVVDLGQPLLGVALAVPGAVSGDGVVLRAPNLPRLTGERVGDRLVRVLALPGISTITVENEANSGALARLYAMPRDGADFVYVSGEIGVGAGLVVNGELFRGVNGFAGELGHVVVDAEGPECSCGGAGCVEQYAGQEVILRAARQPDIATLQQVLADRADEGHDRAAAAVRSAGTALGVGLASLLNVVDLPVVVLGGVYARLFDDLTPSLRTELTRRVLSSERGGGQLRRSSLGSEAAVRGAAGLVLDQAMKNPHRFSEPAWS